MKDEGKLSRAIAKAGAAERLTAQPSAPESAHGPKQPEPLAPTAPPRGFQRVSGRHGRARSDVVIVHDRFGEVASQVRALRARLLAMNDGKPPRVITISSGTREEGKSTLAANLAVALCELGGGRVVLVDGDMAAPGLQLVVGVDPEPGKDLNRILGNGLSLDGNVYETSVADLDFVPCAAVSSQDGYEGLLNQQCGKLLAELRKHYAFVIVDTPPVLAASQACTFGRNSDGVLVVARLESTPREVVKRAIDELSHSGAKIIGCVLTQRKHHVPNFIYRFFGSAPSYYYGYSRKKIGGPPPAGKDKAG